MKKLLFVLAVVLVASIAFAQSGTTGRNPAGQGASIFNGGKVESWNGLATGAGPNNLQGPGLGRHDLFGTNTVTGALGPMGCETCHLPHTAPKYGTTFLWAWSNVPMNVTTYITETNPSGALVGVSTAGTGDNRTGNARSMLCLTCHDGTSATANSISANNTANGGPWALLNTAAGVGSLGSQHPVDAIFPNNVDYVQPVLVATGYVRDSVSATAGVDALPLWTAGTGAASTLNAAVECSSCHDVHNDYQSFSGVPGTGGVPFLRVDNTNGVYLCRECHNQ